MTRKTGLCSLAVDLVPEDRFGETYRDGRTLGFFDFLAKKEKSWDEINAYRGETPPCPNCGTPLVKRFVYSEMYCLQCRYGLDDEEDDDGTEALNVYDAAQIWASHGKDEDYMFGYSWEELEAAL